MNTEAKISYIENNIMEIVERVEILETKLKQISAKVIKIDKGLTTLWGKVKI